MIRLHEVSRGRKKRRVGSYLSVRGYVKKRRFNLFRFTVSPSFWGYNSTRLAAARGRGITGSVIGTSEMSEIDSDAGSASFFDSSNRKRLTASVIVRWH